MTARELAEMVGELIYTEIDDVNHVGYTDGNDPKITVKMESGKRFAISIAEQADA